MIQSWIYKLNSGFAGLLTGNPASAPCPGREGARALFSSGPNSIMMYLRTAAATASGLILLALLLAPSAVYSLTPAQGDMIINSAQFSSAGTPTVTSSVTVTVAFRTTSAIEILTYAPLLPGAELVNLSTTAFRTGSASTDPFIPLLAPLPVGAANPIDLNNPVPLTAATQIHQGDPLFIRVTDKDQNLDRTLAETIVVTVANPANSDVEVLRLTETGPDTGIFVAYLPTTGSAAASYKGSISVNTGDILTTRYVDIVDGSDNSATTIMIDPYGIIFDTATGLPVNGATITLINTTTGLPATIWGDDGVSSYPATLTSGGSATDSSGNVYTFSPGEYRFPFLLPGSYRFEITPPAGYTSPSTVTTTVIQALPGGPFTIVNGSRSEVFLINPGPALRIDVPLDPAPAGLWVQKSTGKNSAGHGDFVPYKLSVTNMSSTAATGGVQLSDTLPIGFRLRKGSVLLNSLATDDPTISTDGRTLTFSIGTIAKGGVATVDYVTEITVGAQIGTATNTAVASSAGVTSNTARATVTVRDDFLRTRSTLMGRISTGACSEETGDGPDGVAGIRIYLEDGSFVVSDKRGLFHFEGIRPGLHVVQMDLDSLPDGYEAFPCTENSRFAGRAFSQFVETQGGTLWRTDFHLRNRATPPPVNPEQMFTQPAVPADSEVIGVPAVAPVTEGVPASVVVPVPAKGNVALELSNKVDGKSIVYTVSMHASSLPVQNTRLNIILPDGVIYQPGSSRMNGNVMADPVQYDKTILVYQLGQLPGSWKHEITFTGQPTAAASSLVLATQAYLAADRSNGAVVLTPPAETTVEQDKDVRIIPMPTIILRPHFPTFGAELDDDDRERLDDLARLLISLHADKIHVTGHTDTVRIAPRSRGIYKDNFALSMARARTVGRYLMEKLHLPPEKLTFDGKGPTVPIASNRTAEGKALNRRVEVQTSSSRRIQSTSRLRVLKAFSGEQAVEVSEVNPIVVPTTAIAGTATVAPENSLTVATLPGTATIGATSDSGTAVTAAPVALAAIATPAAASGNLPATTLSPAVVVGKAAPIFSPNVPETSAMSREGILSLEDNDILVNQINSIRVCLDSRLTPRLQLDKKEVPANRIGFTMKDEKAGKTIYSYIGVDFGERGDHVVEFQGIDPFGNVRFKQTRNVKRSGEIVSIRLISAEGNVADGRTPVRLRLELYDVDGNRVLTGAELEIRSGTLKTLKEKGLFSVIPAAGSFEQVPMNREGEVLFQPVNNSGLYRVVLGHNKATIEVETYVQPKLRDWILVGMAEGTVGYNTVSGNMESISSTGVKEDLYQSNRVALYAKGQIQGKWLLTTAYDSTKQKETSGGLFQTINPETYYTLYGDATQQQYDAASTKNLYVKIEREQFYAMFGDYDTGLTVTELSRYSRRMTGFKSEMQAQNYEFSAFASETRQVYVRDEIPGDGTSGMYYVSNKKIVSNSEKIIIEVRDRFKSEVVISSRTLSRFTEYSIDYDTGGIFFKEPVFSRDENFNPITIVAEYEIISTGGANYSYGGRAGLKLLDQKLKAGGSYIREEQGVRVSNLYGLDTSLKIGDGTKLRAEFATSDYTDGTTSRNGNAYLAEVTHNSKTFDVKAYIREQETGFGLGQQSGTESGTRKFGAEGTYRLTDHLSTNAGAYRQYTLLTGAVRDVAEGKVAYNDPHWGLSLGVLHANDTLGDGSNKQSNQLTAGGKVLTLYDRLTLTVNHAQSVGENSNKDFPTRTTFGGELKVLTNLTLLGAQEFTWGETATTQNTRLGIRSTPWKGASITSSVERQLNENAERVFANIGVKQNWQVTDTWKVDAGLDRSQTLAKNSAYLLNTNVASASGGTENFTAISTGATYQVKYLTWDNRAEVRIAETQDKWGLLSGVVNEINTSLAWSGRAQIYQTLASTGIDTTQSNLRFGLVFRPPQTKWILLNRLDYYLDNQSGGTSSNGSSWRLVNNLNANYRPFKELQISLQYGAKYVKDMINSSSYSGFTDHIGVETRYDITKKWDFGVRGSIMHSWYDGQLSYSAGPSTGYNIAENAWISIGYNVVGFTDKDFSAADYTIKGPYIRFRIKFDQQSVKDAAGWLNKQ